MRCGQRGWVAFLSGLFGALLVGTANISGTIRLLSI
jgi:hypothetical protein